MSVCRPTSKRPSNASACSDGGDIPSIAAAAAAAAAEAVIGGAGEGLQIQNQNLNQQQQNLNLNQQQTQNQQQQLGGLLASQQQQTQQPNEQQQPYGVRRAREEDGVDVGREAKRQALVSVCCVVFVCMI